jgi:hypothetical protein
VVVAQLGNVMGVTSEENFKHRDNLNTSLPVDGQQEDQVVDAGFNR